MLTNTGWRIIRMDEGSIRAMRKMHSEDEHGEQEEETVGEEETWTPAP